MESAAGTVVLYPFPVISQLVSMVELGKLIHTNHPSLSIIVFITPTPSENDSIDKYINNVSANTPSITFHHLPPIALPPGFSTEFLDIAFRIPELYTEIVHTTLIDISEKSTITAFILHFFSNAAFKVAKSLELPVYYFYSLSASALCVLLYLPTIHKTTTKSIKDLDIYFDIPGVPPVHASDMPPFLWDRESNVYKNFLNTSTNIAESSGIITKSLVGFEERAVGTIRSGKCIPDDPTATPPVYLVGPLMASVDPSEENECIKWLNLQPSKSVVFLCFGSMHVFTREQLKEIAFGLERSGQRFLWVVRNQTSGDNSSDTDFSLDDILPQGFLAKTGDKGLVVKNWAPQPAILSHESVGGFVTHCGWNATLEALVAGVPMVAWPLYLEQKMNRVFLVNEMKVALELKISTNDVVTAEVLEETVTELMQGEKGRAVRERVLEMSEVAKVAVAPPELTFLI